jgi:hypothetical protein
MSSDEGDWTQLQPGFPIRSPPDHSSVANSPGLIAGSYDLHRLSVPRHPPCALSSLSPPRTKQHNKQQKMLASTMQISNNTRTNPVTAAYPHPPPPPHTPGRGRTRTVRHTRPTGPRNQTQPGARSLRTQQRATHRQHNQHIPPPPPTHPTHTTTAHTGGQATHHHKRGTNPPGGRNGDPMTCSLERR